MAFGIYSITNIVTGDMYIGQTKVSFESRWREHIGSLKRGTHDNNYLQRSWVKYGEEGFKFEAIHLCDELDILDDLEIYYIKKYDTYMNGYNLTPGGNNYLPSTKQQDHETRIKRLRNAKQASREKSDYTETQIARVKQLLVDEDYCNNLEKIEKITGVKLNIIYSVRKLATWIDIREDLNEEIKMLNDKNLRNIEIIKDCNSYNYNIEELCEKYKLSQYSIKLILKKNKVNYPSIFKKVNGERVLAIIKKAYYEEDIKTWVEMERRTNKSRYTLRNIMKSYNLELELEELRKRSICVANQCKTKGISFDKESSKWFLRITYEGKQIPIGKFETVGDAEEVRDELIIHIENKNYDKIMEIKNKYTKEGTPKKKILAINVETGEAMEIEGIGVASKELNMPRRSIKKVLSGKQKSTYGYKFEYVS